MRRRYRAWQEHRRLQRLAATLALMPAGVIEDDALWFTRPTAARWAPGDAGDIIL